MNIHFKYRLVPLAIVGDKPKWVVLFYRSWYPSHSIYSWFPRLLASAVGEGAGTLPTRARHSAMYPKCAFRIYSFRILFSLSSVITQANSYFLYSEVPIPFLKMNAPPSPLKQHKTNMGSGYLFSLLSKNPNPIRSPAEGPEPCADIWNPNFIALMKRKQFSSIYNNILVCRGSADWTLPSQVNTPGVSDGGVVSGACNKSAACGSDWRPCWWCLRTRLTGAVTVYF